MKTLTEQFKDIAEERSYLSYDKFIEKLLRIVKERDAYVIGEYYDAEYCTSYCEKVHKNGHLCYHEIKNEELKEIRKRAEETL